MLTIAQSRPILSVRRLKVQFPLRRGRVWPLFGPRGTVRAVDDLHFDLYAGETLGIVGESGCGKTSLARALVGLETAVGGQISIEGRPVAARGEVEWRRTVQMLFQDPAGGFDPRMTIGKSIDLQLAALMPELDKKAYRERVLRMLERVGLDADVAERRPRELSGEQCQRAAIARALIVQPRVLICDEPLSALDVSVQAQILQLLAELQRECGLAMLFISNDLAVVRQLSHRVLVMYFGKIMEQALRDRLFESPQHPYTRALLSSLPSLPAFGGFGGERVELSGELPNPADPPSGCVFRTRCPLVDHVCAQQVPVLRRVPSGGYSACHFAAYAESPMIPRTA